MTAEFSKVYSDSLICGNAVSAPSKAASIKLAVLQDDSTVLEDLASLVEMPPDPGMEALSAGGCTGELLSAV